MDSEEAVYRDFRFGGLSLIDAVSRLEALGYQPKDAEEVVSEWADEAEWAAKRDDD